MEEIGRRRQYTLQNAEALQGELRDADLLLEGKACVYATGSYGRLEARPDSDLDLFIVGLTDIHSKQTPKGSLLRHLDEICIKADLIRATKRLGIKDFDGDGRYLAHYSAEMFTKTLGTPEDDATNTLTGRLLLLLESRPLLGKQVYSEVIRTGH